MRAGGHTHADSHSQSIDRDMRCTSCDRLHAMRPSSCDPFPSRALALSRSRPCARSVRSLSLKDIQGSDGGSVYDYSLHVCGPLTAPCTESQPNAAACQVQVNPAGQAFDIGDWAGLDETILNYIDPSNPGLGVTYQMVGAQSCWATGQPSDYYANVIVSRHAPQETQVSELSAWIYVDSSSFLSCAVPLSSFVDCFVSLVQFACAENEGPMTVTYASLSCVRNYTIPTPLACGSAPPPPPPPPSTPCGWNGYDMRSAKMCTHKCADLETTSSK
jgi:hypothetical protein